MNPVVDVFLRLLAGLIEGIVKFLQSPAFPYVFWVLVAVLVLWILWKIYLRIREKNLKNISYSREFTEKGVYAGD